MTITTTVGSLGELLRVWRQSAGFTTRDLAERISPYVMGISHATIARYERNLGVPSTQVLLEIAHACGRSGKEIPEAFQESLEHLKLLVSREDAAPINRCYSPFDLAVA